MTRLAPKREILVNVGKKGSRSNSSPAAPTRKSVCFEGSVVVVAIEFAVSRAGADVCFLPESALLVKRKKTLCCAVWVAALLRRGRCIRQCINAGCCRLSSSSPVVLSPVADIPRRSCRRPRPGGGCRRLRLVLRG